jgi:hypothetical protein
MQSYIVLSAIMTFALWGLDSINRTSAGSWQSAPLFQSLR